MINTQKIPCSILLFLSVYFFLELGHQFSQINCFQVLPYDQLMQELDVTNVRELEDFLINECMYAVGHLFLPESI